MQVDKNPSAYYFSCTDEYFYLEINVKMFNPSPPIKINRQTCKIQQIDKKVYEQYFQKTHNDKKLQPICLIIGQIIVNQQPYLSLVTQAAAVGTLNKDRIYQIKNVKFIPFKHKFLYDSIDQSQNDKILGYLRDNILNNMFYFTYHEDITLTKIKSYKNKITERKYFWNEHNLKFFSRYSLPLCWRIPILQGHVAQLYSQFSNLPYYYVIISRRSKFNSGTRFNSRGIDHNFNVANYVQTQQIFIFHNLLFSHVSIRGSVPIFWQQISFNSGIKFIHSTQQNQLMIKKHYQFLQKQYNSSIITINLLSNIHEQQMQLKNRMQLYYHRCIQNRNYIYFDLNDKMNNNKNGQQMIDQFIYHHKTIISPNFNFLSLDKQTNSIITMQSKISRVNCLDCIDRTNVVLYRISQIFLQDVIKFIKQKMIDKSHMLQNLEQDLKKKVLQLWVQLGDRISNIYCGTDCKATHMTKKQNNSFFSSISGSLKSANRFYNAYMNDSYKQDCLNYLLGQNQQFSYTPFFEDNINKSNLQEHQYCQYEEYSMYFLTWNCNMMNPSSLTLKNCENLFNFGKNDIDLVVIGLQQMVQLSSYNVLIGSSNQVVLNWKNILNEHLNLASKNRNGPQYNCIVFKDLVGVALFVFCHTKLKNKIHYTDIIEIKTGFHNNLGNKGAIVLFLQIESTPITIITAHLAAGQNKFNQRLQDIQYIHHNAINQRKYRRKWDLSDFRFFIGDMNFRLDQKNQKVRQILYKLQKQDNERKLSIKQRNQLLKPLLQKDQFKIHQSLGILNQYDQGQIYFLPTYKFQKKTNNYDLKRTPSWCDRILYFARDKLKINLIRYQNVNCNQSDHMPVFAIYQILVKIQNQDQKKKTIEFYMNKQQKQ